MISDDVAAGLRGAEEPFSREAVSNMILNSMIGTTVQTALGMDDVFDLPAGDRAEEAAAPAPA